MLDPAVATLGTLGRLAFLNEVFLLDRWRWIMDDDDDFKYLRY